MAASPPLGLTDWLSFAASFAFVLLLITSLYFLLKRLAGGRLRVGCDKQMGVIESQSVGNRQRIVLVRAKDREILLGMTMNQITTLATWSADELAKCAPANGSLREPAGRARSHTTLQQLLGSLQSKHKQ